MDAFTTVFEIGTRLVKKVKQMNEIQPVCVKRETFGHRYKTTTYFWRFE
jgi:hypothetical protein